MGLLAALSLTSCALTARTKTPSFPGAQGGGAAAVGGRGGSVCEVTNLSDSGRNSFRDCLTRSGPRTVVFRVAGTIWLRSGIYIVAPYITIAGQTAPGGGITLGGKQMNTDSMIYIETHDVVVRYIRVRVGTGPGHSGGPSAGVVGFFVGNADVYNVMLDHVSISWSDNKPVLLYSNYGPGVHNVSMQWSMNNEGLSPTASRPNSQATCGGTGAPNSNQVNSAFHDDDFHHNFMSNCSHRLPEVGQKTMRFVNNIIYNWSYFATATYGPQSSDIIGNLYKSGPYTPGAQPKELHFSDGAGTYTAGWVGAPDIYMFGNKGPSQPNPSGDQWAMAGQNTCFQCSPMGPVPTAWRRDTPLPTQQHPISADDVNNLENILFPTVGASQRLDCKGNWVPNRDAVDTRLINEYKAGAGIIPTSETQVGGFPSIDPGTACADSDHDGMPDAWEIAHGLNPKDPSDGRKLNRDGYTNLEHFLNGGSPGRTHHSNRRQQPNDLSPRSHVR